MPLKQKHIEDLKAIFEKEFGYRPDDKEAWDMATRLINLFRLLTGSDNHPNDDSA
jgi:hypothetical protein